MAKKKNKKKPTATVKHNKKKSFVFLYLMAGLVVFLLVLGFYFFSYKAPVSVYVFPENPKQGDTVFIRVKSNASKVVGNFGQESLVFYEKDYPKGWVSFLGIDADQQPGEYTISVDTSNAEHLVKGIKIEEADFSSAPLVVAPSLKQTGITVEKAVTNITKNDNPALKKVLTNFTTTPYFTSSFSLPLNTVEKTGLSFGEFVGFGNDKLQHLGTDLRAQEKTNVYAVNDGKIVAILNLSNYGKTIIIDHGLDIFSLYLHLEEFKVSDGQMIKKGSL